MVREFYRNAIGHVIMKQINKYQLQQELKKELHNRQQENSKFFFYEDFVTIEYNDQQDWIYANWKGPQTEKSLMDGFEKILETVRYCQSSKVLNDDTNAMDIWKAASEWLAKNWLPRFKLAGVSKFAWVCAVCKMSKMANEDSFRNTAALDMFQTFTDLDLAKKWLSHG